MGCHVKDLLSQLNGLSCCLVVGQLHLVHALLEGAPLVLASLQGKPTCWASKEEHCSCLPL